VHSRRTDPTNRSAIAFILGACGVVMIAVMPVALNTPSNAVSL
jgi:hypothetical protein